MGHAALIDEPLIETEQGSVIAPVWIDGLAPALRALGHELQRKQEFHLTALSRRVFETAANGGDRGWTRCCTTTSTAARTFGWRCRPRM